MSAHGLVQLEGTFDYIEAKIRRDADGTAFGGDFEWLCRWFLLNAPRYRGQFERVWLWNEWPDRWGPDAGIDLVARTRTGELWAIQAKADHPDRAIAKREIDSFLSESSRPEFVYRLLMATTDDIGRNARRTLEAQEKPVGLVLRGHFLTEELVWPVEIGGTATPLPRLDPRPHQATAIRDVLAGFQIHDRGQLIMAGGTGKTLTALWIAEQLQSSLTLVLVPSLSLVAQNLREWGRNTASAFDQLVVCSDESVVQRKEDAAIQSTADLGVKVTTDPLVIRHFLDQPRQRSAVVFGTYQSSDRLAAAQTNGAKPFDLAVCDEAHCLAGHSEGLFATVLDDRKIKARKRLFMTATPRYFKEHLKRRAAELDYELVSMDDHHVFGPEFRVLTFHEAITADPPLLTDYQVVVIGVTDPEIRAWAEEARLVRTADGVVTDARKLAGQIGLAKAIRKYGLQKIITFHSSIAKAERFVDTTRRDSLPGVIPSLTESSRPSGKLWAKHISGHTPAGKRTTLLKELGNLPDGTHGIISNCACLGEGVDVPVLDGVAFIDPKRSMVDIIQAVGRVIRKADNKTIGTVVVPVFIDESQDPDTALSQSAFEPVWQVLKALRAHDRRLADELDNLRLSLGRQWASSRRIALPPQIRLDVPEMLLQDFEQAFYVRTVEATTPKPLLTVEQILVWADEHKTATGNWPNKNTGSVAGTDDDWTGIDRALRCALRGLPGNSSLAKLLAEYRDVRNIQDLPPLTIEKILTWVDEYHASTKDWPDQKSGRVRGTPETWIGIDSALQRGNRGLPRGSSLAKVLDKHRGVRNRGALPKLTIEQILKWADEHIASTGRPPKKGSGQVAGTSETWSGIDCALQKGQRGLPGGLSLPKLLEEYRGVPNAQSRPLLSEDQILAWADAYHEATGYWPNKSSGPIAGTEETWAGVNAAFRRGKRGLPRGSSLAKLLAEHRGVRNTMDLPDLTIEQILAWMDAHKAATGDWPNRISGRVTGATESWAGIDQALWSGRRGLPGGSSLARLLARHRGVRNTMDLPELTIEQILAWVHAHKSSTGDWPNQKTGQVTGTDEKWIFIDDALRSGRRGLPGGSSLAKLLAERCGVRNKKDLPDLTIEQILTWADTHHASTGDWPNQETGQVTGTEETWAGVNSALDRGNRGLPGGSSLANLLAERRGVRNRKNLPPLTTQQILAWADAHKTATGSWPNNKSGQVTGTGETWAGINAALHRGSRGLPGGSSLAKLFAEHRHAPR